MKIKLEIEFGMNEKIVYSVNPRYENISNEDISSRMHQKLDQIIELIN